MQNVVLHRRQDFSLIIKSSGWQHMLLQKLCIFFNILLVVPPNMLLMLCALMTLYTITDAGFLTVCWQQARCCLSSLAVHNLKNRKGKKKSHFETRGLFSSWTQSVEGRTLIYPQSQSTRGHWMFDEHASDASRTLWQCSDHITRVPTHMFALNDYHKHIINSSPCSCSCNSSP